MKRGNVLVIGNSGVGKSTLINAVLGKEVAPTGWGVSGTTPALHIYEEEGIPFNVVDTIGFEPSFLKKTKAINAVKRWSKESAKSDLGEKQINVIWFCVDGTSRKLFPETIKSLSKATAMWESVPVIVVITKSYSVKERAQNVEMVNNAFAMQKGHSKNLRKVIPVVASTYELNDTAFVAPEGILELIDATNALIPEGLKAAQKDVAAFMLNRKRALSQSVIAASTAAGAVACAAPLPFTDGTVLTGIEIAEINALAKIYGIEDSQDVKMLVQSIVEAGTASVVAKAALGALKAVPGVNVGAVVLNAIVAGAIVVAIGEGSAYAFEKIYLGEKNVTDIAWVKKIMESKLSNELVDKATAIAEELSKADLGKDPVKAVANALVSALGSADKTANPAKAN